jgi:F-type H+-transporting ATPase subunit alpha
VEVQVALIWAVQNGYIDDVPVERVTDFQAGWAEFLRTRRPAVLERIRAEKVLSEELSAALKGAADQFKQTWK